MDHYERLGVERDATASEIRDAYRRRARAVHPDRAGAAGDEGDAEMVALNDAYRTLRDAARRSRYDAGFVPVAPDAHAADHDRAQPSPAGRRFRGMLAAAWFAGVAVASILLLVAFIEGH